MADEPVRKSIAQRVAQLKSPEREIAETITAEQLDSAVTASFRVEATGELAPTAAATVAAPAYSSQQLGELPPKIANSHHLLLLPKEHTGEELEALAISVWDEAGWTAPGTLHLTEGATLEGPWTLPDSDCNGWILRCAASRAAAPSPAIMEIDPWARAFPDGMPVGTEYKTLVTLHRIARRLDGKLRLAGSDTVMAPDRESAVNLRIYAPDYLPSAYLREVLEEYFPNLEGTGTAVAAAMGVAVTPTDTPPYAFLLPVGLRSKIIVGIRKIDQPPRVLRWEPWSRRPAFLYEINWVNSREILGEAEATLRAGALSRVARTERGRVILGIEQVARLLTEHLAPVAVVDEDSFLLAVDDLALLPEPPDTAGNIAGG